MRRNVQVTTGIYRASRQVKGRIYVLSMLFAGSALAIPWFAVRLWGQSRSDPSLGQGPLWWLLGFLVTIVAPALILYVAAQMVRWVNQAQLSVGPEGLLYEEPAGSVQTSWQNVVKLGTVRKRVFVLVGGLHLRQPAEVQLAEEARLIAALRPGFLPAVSTLPANFLPLSLLGVEVGQGQPFTEDLRRWAPWVFEQRD